MKSTNVEHDSLVPDASPTTGPTVHQPRAYQMELFEMSMKRNVIVCMGTGSGKTQIAKLRIEAELKRSPTKLVWFLAPRVNLAHQQHAYLKSQLGAYQFRIMTGEDNVEHWSTQEIWDAALWQMHVIVSTPQVLHDALMHGFVTMGRLSLLVFDEAHHCTAKAPMNRIMQNHYHLTKNTSTKPDLPYVLGLSASPITGMKRGDLEKLEKNLDAICRTPTLHVDEYQRFVHEPEFVSLSYTPIAASFLPILIRLEQVINSLDIDHDPEVRYLRQQRGLKNEAKLVDVLAKRSTFCSKQMRKFCDRALDTYRDLGEWACYRFITECTRRLHSTSSTPTSVLPTLESQQRKYMNSLLSDIRLQAEDLANRKLQSNQFSSKATTLVDFLVQEHTPEISCVVFVKQRSTAWALSQVLSSHPRCLGHYSSDAVVGGSKLVRSFDLVELIKTKDPGRALANFRSGQVNICVATQVMEEGIDIPATNVVVRWDDSENFRSFIQSRGRARHSQSKFVTLLQPGNEGTSYVWWKELEKEMKAKYADEERAIAEMEVEEDTSFLKFRVESTGAMLTPESAQQHIGNFCSRLPKVPYADDPQAEYILLRLSLTEVTARIILPACVDPDLRETAATKYWRSERTARNEAAYQAYIRLYKAGLINENLLPTVVPFADDSGLLELESRDSTCQAQSCVDPWREVAAAWTPDVALCMLQVDIHGLGQGLPPMLLILPMTIETSLEFPLHWTLFTKLSARICPMTMQIPPTFQMTIGRQVTQHLWKTIFSRKMRSAASEQCDYPCLITPIEYVHSLQTWLKDPLKTMKQEEKSRIESYLVRRERDSIPYFFRDQGAFDETIEFGDELCLVRLPKRIDFLQPLTSDRAHTAWESVPRSECSIELLPASYARTMMFMPSVLHILGIALVAQKAKDTFLSPIGFRNTVLVMNALVASSANEYLNYQRLEFLGDSLLKFYASIHLFTRFAKWHEGHLSAGKDRIVSNSRLCQAAKKKDLDRFIHSKPFAGAQWKVRTNTEILKEADAQENRQLSTKVLADVVEALIGAAHEDGNDRCESETKTLACMKLFLPEVRWDTIKDSITNCSFPTLPDGVAVDTFLSVERMIGYRFHNRLILAEALTHPSAIASFGSYQRLEFLGDAVLDHIVVDQLFRAKKEFRHFDLHLMRTALVNADYLAFLCLEATVDLERMDVSTSKVDHFTGSGAYKTTLTATTERKRLCHFMTTMGNAIGFAQESCIERHEQLREKIIYALEQEKTYPWSLLIRLGADKFVSDIVESILGAVFVDSGGSIEACQTFLGQIGLLKYLNRLAQESEMQIMHPKERLGVVSKDATISYENSSEVDQENNHQSFTSRVLVNGEVFAVAEGGWSRLEAETRAAEMAIARFC